MILAIGWVSFNRELEARGIVSDYRVGDFFVAEFFQLKNVCFSADAPWPKTVAVTVRNQGVFVKFA